MAKEERPGREVVLVRPTAGWARAAATAGSSTSLTHGLPNGAARFASELEALEDLGGRTWS